MTGSEIVLKFGGSSLSSASAFKKVAQIITGFTDPIVVVSAIGTRRTKRLKITDLLFSAAQKAFQKKNFHSDFNEIKQRHRKILSDLKLNIILLDSDFNKLEAVLSKKRKGRSEVFYDAVVSFGELMSTKILSSFLERQGIHAVAIDAADIGMITDSNFGYARPLQKSSILIRKKLSTFKNIPIISGFVGKDIQGRRTTLGRGGSDFSASIIASALNAREIRIYTDVDGIFSADPRLINKAKVIPKLSFYEASELAYFGARVLHPETIYPAIEKDIPVRVLNTFNTKANGTVIVAKESHTIKAVTWKKGVTVIDIYSTRMFAVYGFLSKIFNVFARHEVVIDVLATSNVSVSLTVDTKPSTQLIKELSKFADVSFESNFSSVSLVGGGIRDKQSVLGKLFTAIKNYPIKMVSQGASKRNITFLIKEKYLNTVVKKIFNAFFNG